MTAGTLILVTSAVVIALGLAAVRHAYRDRPRVIGAVALAVAGWLALLGFVTRMPQLRDPDALPPPFAFLFAAIIGVGVFAGLSPLGRKIAETVSIRWLVLFQAFRLFAEISLYLAFVEGLAPKQMTWLGNNMDVTTALAALLVAGIPFFSALGLGNLVVIAVTAALSMPSPLRYYMDEPSQVWVTYLPYIYLPGVLVTGAFAGHFVLLRAIRIQVPGREAKSPAPSF